MNIEGRWHGFYEYGLGYQPPVFGERVNFQLDISGDESSFVGSIKEADSGYSVTEIAQVKGFVSDGLISFVKRYDQGIAVEGSDLATSQRSYEVSYSGNYHQTYDCFFGIWELLQEPTNERGKPELLGEGIWQIKRTL